MRHFREKISILLAKKPGLVVLLAILFFNLLLILISATVLNAMSLRGTESMGFWHAAFYTVTMILDAGCIDFVISELGEIGVGVAIFCIAVILAGMVLFTGAVIGYLANFISKFIEQSDGSRKLLISNHTVILEWNSRASEIVNEMLYLSTPQKIVILTGSDKEEIREELDERLQSTVDQENKIVERESEDFLFFKRFFYRIKHRFKNRLTIVIRQGDTFSTKQLNDISIKHAKTIVILGRDMRTMNTCKYNVEKHQEELERGNPQSIKALVQVADLTASENSDDNQKIVIEVEDDWTLYLVNKIIEQKAVRGKCNITPVCVNQILGQLLSQFSLMPELNLVYRELFSNKGMTFYSKPVDVDEPEFFARCLSGNSTVLPLAVMTGKSETEAGTCEYGYYAAQEESDIQNKAAFRDSGYRVAINPDYWIEQKNVIILGHNSKIADIMAGFSSFCNEWNTEDQNIVRIVAIDDKKNLEKMDYYRGNPSVIKTVEADLCDRDIICSAIEEFVDSNESDTSILILSDDTEQRDRIDTSTISYLIYVRDIIQKKRATDPNFGEGRVDVIVEILNPKHYDIVKNYSISNIVISNRYISKMITQIGEKEALFNFFEDILSYDEAGQSSYESKEIYIKKVSRYFSELPGPCTAAELVTAVYQATSDPSPDGNHDEAITLGYVDAEENMHLFTGNRNKIKVNLDEKCKLIVFGNH